MFTTPWPHPVNPALVLDSSGDKAQLVRPYMHLTAVYSIWSSVPSQYGITMLTSADFIIVKQVIIYCALSPKSLSYYSTEEVTFTALKLYVSDISHPIWSHLVTFTNNCVLRCVIFNDSIQDGWHHMWLISGQTKRGKVDLDTMVISYD